MNGVAQEICCFAGLPGLTDDLEILQEDLGTSWRLRCYTDVAALQASVRSGEVSAPRWLLGYSRGCVEALRAASLWPDLRGVLAVAPHPGTAPAPLMMAVLGLPGLGDWLLSRMAAVRIERFLQESCAPEPVPDSYAQRGGLYARADVLRAALLRPVLPASDVAAALDRVASVPQCLVLGAVDRPNPLANAWAQARPGRHVEILPGAGHALPWTRTAAVARILRRFLEETNHV